MQSYLSRGLGARYSPQDHSHHGAQLSRTHTAPAPRLQVTTSPRLASHRSVSSGYSVTTQKVSHGRVFNKTVRLTCREPPPETLHLPPQLLSFTANERLNTAPSVRPLSVLTLTISTLKLTLFLNGNSIRVAKCHALSVSVTQLEPFSSVVYTSPTASCVIRLLHYA